MNKFKNILIGLLHPKFYISLPLIVISTVGLIYVFSSNMSSSHPIAITMYAVSAYTLTVVCVGFVPFVKRVNGFLHNFRYTQRLVSDALFRAKITLFCGLAFNLVYAGYNFFLGTHQDSFWLISISIYYAAVAVIRFTITLGVRRARKSKDKYIRLVNEWKRYRFAGIASLFLTLTMSVLIGLVLFFGESFKHSGYAIFIFAAYTFIKFATAIMGTIKFHSKYDSPVLSASKALNLSMAVMSIFALQTAMFSEFNSPESMFNTTKDTLAAADVAKMNTITGIAVWTLSLTIAVYMIVNSTKKLKKLQEQGPPDA